MKYFPKRLDIFDLSFLEDFEFRTVNRHFRQCFAGYLCLAISLGQLVTFERFNLYLYSYFYYRDSDHGKQEGISSYKHLIGDIILLAQVIAIAPVNIILKKRKKYRVAIYSSFVVLHSLILAYFSENPHSYLTISIAIGTSGGLVEAAVMVAPFVIIREYCSKELKTISMIFLFGSAKAFQHLFSFILIWLVDPNLSTLDPNTGLMPESACTNINKKLLEFSLFTGSIGLFGVLLIHLSSDESQMDLMNLEKCKSKIILSKLNQKLDSLKTLVNTRKQSASSDLSSDQTVSLELEKNSIGKRTEKTDLDDTTQIEESLLKKKLDKLIFYKEREQDYLGRINYDLQNQRGTLQEKFETDAQIIYKEIKQSEKDSGVALKRRISISIFAFLTHAGFASERLLLNYQAFYVPTKWPEFVYPGFYQSAICSISPYVILAAYGVFYFRIESLRDSIGIFMMIGGLLYGLMFLSDRGPTEAVDTSKLRGWTYALYVMFLQMITHIRMFSILIVACFYFYPKRWELIALFSMSKSFYFLIIQITAEYPTLYKHELLYIFTCGSALVLYAVMGFLISKIESPSKRQQIDQETIGNDLGFVVAEKELNDLINSKDEELLQPGMEES